GGGTTISEGTLQIGDGGTTGSIKGDVTNNAALIFDRSNSMLYRGDISGTGTVEKNSADMLIMIGANTYTGGSTIAEGTLQIGDGSTLGSIDGDVTNNAALVFARSDAITYGGVISGTGTLQKSSVGTLTLTGANTYTGGTTISEGTLQIGDGGTSGSIVGDVVNNAALVFNRSDDLSYGGVISGTGTLTKRGSGALTLTGTHTYAGVTEIDDGTLIVNGSVGEVSVNSGGTLGG